MHLHCFNKVKIVTIYALLVCKIFGLKIRSCKFFYKSQVWVENHDGFGHLYKKKRVCRKRAPGSIFFG